MDVSITTTDTGKIALTTPYSADLVKEAKTLGGKWDAASKTWQFDSRDETRVRELALKFFGTDGREPEGADLVTVRVKLADHEGDKWNKDATFANRRIAHRPGRDSSVVLAANVVLVEGKLGRGGGSMRYPAISASDDVIVEIRDIPRSSLKLERDDSYTIVGEQIDVDALLAEREQLLARLAEIDALLPEPEGTTATTREAAAALGVSIRTVQRWAATGKVEATKDNGRWIVTITTKES